jgi:hypothetical protein
MFGIRLSYGKGRFDGYGLGIFIVLFFLFCGVGATCRVDLLLFGTSRLGATHVYYAE